MSEISAATPVAPAPPRRARSGWGRALLLLVLLLLAAGSVTGYLWLRDAQQSVEALEQKQKQLLVRVASLETANAEISQSVSRDTASLAEFGERLDHYDLIAGKLAEELQGGRVRFTLQSVENLLLAANERVQLQHDIRGAAAALDLADQRLAGLSEPRLFKLREEIARERSALLALPEPDLTSAALTLSSLIARAPDLPLRTRIPSRSLTLEETVEPPPAQAWSDSLWSNVKLALRSVFAVRRADGPVPRLLPADQEAVVYQVLALKLEGVRMAMLRGDATSYRDLCDSAAAWLRQYFRPDDPGVMAATAELERLRALTLEAPAADITRSLTLLRTYLNAPAQQ
ncbi:MAG TPA: uroporphyrinogen-III C-methyltransferase [Nevskiaceae bacterium]|nr:uroporphyrinogen-III C-methyltransferase [Nevskiaceae bacterium]